METLSQLSELIFTGCERFPVMSAFSDRLVPLYEGGGDSRVSVHISKPLPFFESFLLVSKAARQSGKHKKYPA
ncbi:hypothetical protein AUL54_02810 [Bacillus sp. SDLI1]|uniref:Uncharacterized protein n=1 Tax=Bacillus siamensis TaxID=659243 RepID=A0AAI8HPH2_9BACI|nr:hypothetical protein AUL54_02810 [Bacillus sp. SDLI1]AUJ77765.1 hypothetical protein CWD84_13495 [Bacillus siamensis]